MTDNPLYHPELSCQVQSLVTVCSHPVLRYVITREALETSKTEQMFASVLGGTLGHVRFTGWKGAIDTNTLVAQWIWVPAVMHSDDEQAAEYAGLRFYLNVPGLQSGWYRQGDTFNIGDRDVELRNVVEALGSITSVKRTYWEWRGFDELLKALGAWLIEQKV